MGNCSSEAQQTKIFRIADLSNDPTAFRVFVKKRNKFIPGWLKINDEEIVYTRGGNNIQFWPLAYLRRYGYTCSGVFFFESGRRCATGEGLHTFQSHQAERIFQLVQSKIKIEEYARGSRAPSVSSTKLNGVNRIHPVQRFYSANNEFSLGTPMISDQGCLPYLDYHHHNHHPAESHRQQQSPSCSLASAPIYNCGVTSNRFPERPRSVVSALGHSVRVPNPCRAPTHLFTNGSNAMTNSFHSTTTTTDIGGGSPWPRTPQLEGDIVLEHVLSRSGYGALQNSHPPATLSNNANYFYRPPPLPPKQHTYVNLDFSSASLFQQHQKHFIAPTPMSNRELYRTTNQSRNDFLSATTNSLHPEVPTAPIISVIDQQNHLRRSSPMQKSVQQTNPNNGGSNQNSTDCDKSVSNRLNQNNSASSSFSSTLNKASKRIPIPTGKNPSIIVETLKPSSASSAFRPITAVTITNSNGQIQAEKSDKTEETKSLSYTQINVDKTLLLSEKISKK